MSDSLIEEAKKNISQHGGRMTSQRLIILEILEASAGHLTAEELYEIVAERDPGINLSTIYRTLRWLEQEGLVSARLFDEDHGQARFDAGQVEDHHHFVCTRCRKVIEFSTPYFQKILSKFVQETGICVSGGSVVLHGLCNECAAQLEPIQKLEVNR